MRRRGYPISTKLQALGMLETMSDYKVSAALDVPRRNWMSQRHEILAYDGNLQNIKLEPAGRYDAFPEPPGLIEFINHVRDNERALTTTHLIMWIKQAYLAEVQSDFVAVFHREYIAYGKECVYNADETGIYYDMPSR
ncbi:hypothetical protein B5M09_013482 [Aphanomyces astaci]|uniref:Uncharacterized protein n=1 Tax=Aphanomyces astaci TaxID=112090 RepID=A0A3R7Y3N2_APHAT|nr:hypothetical protein B5M09_013482 [Aphanomyces astaci]